MDATGPTPGTDLGTARTGLALLVGSPRVAAGLLTRSAWQVLGAADTVYAVDLTDPLPVAVAESGVPVEALAEDPASLARVLLDAAAERAVVWLGSPDADPGLTDAIASEVSRLGNPPEVEVVVGSWDVPGARLLDVVAVMDRLRSPGGCPWDAEQTHRTLVPYLLEEAHEAVEAIESGDRTHLVEELGDVLLQVAFHSRVGEEDTDDPFDIDDVAGALVDKLVRRHPHVFADGDADTPEAVEREWERIKLQEKAARATPGSSAGPAGLADGIPLGLPALDRAQKVLTRMRRRGLDTDDLPGDGLGAELLLLARRAVEQGMSAETELRTVLRGLEGRDLGGAEGRHADSGGGAGAGPG